MLGKDESMAMEHLRYARPFTLVIVIFLFNMDQVSLQSCQFLLKLTKSIRPIT